MIDQLSHRINRAESDMRQLYNNPAPTVPQYDLDPAASGPTGAVFYMQSNDYSLYYPIIQADTTYLHEFHFVANDRLEWYIDGVLKQIIINFFSPGYESASIGFDFGMASATVAGDIVYMWDMKWGTTRGGTDLFYDAMDTAPPTVPPWTSEFSGDLSDISTTTIGSDTVTQFGDAVTGGLAGHLGYTGVSSPTDCWYSFNLRVPPSTISVIVPGDTELYQFELRASNHSYLLARMWMGLPGD